MIIHVSLLCLWCFIGNVNSSLRVKYSWKYIDYVWEDAQQKSRATESGDYNSTKNIPYDVDQDETGRVFVTIVRDVGVPATLATVSDESGKGGPLLEPYPSWSYNDKNDCKNLIAVYRIAITCNFLWVLDTGKIGEQQVCPPKLVIIRLTTDRIIKTITIPKEIATNSNGTGLLVTPIANTPDTGCGRISQSQIYMADTEGYGMVVWNGRNLYRIDSDSFLPEQTATNFKIEGQSFSLADGLLGMALERSQPDIEKRRLYYRPLASFSMFHTDAIGLNKKTTKISYKKASYKLSSQSAAQAFSKSGVLFYSSSGETAIMCWDHKKPFDANNNVKVAVDREALQFASGVKVVTNVKNGKEHLYVMTNRYQQVVNGVIDFTDVNFRILTGRVDELVKGTNCEC